MKRDVLLLCEDESRQRERDRPRRKRRDKEARDETTRRLGRAAATSRHGLTATFDAAEDTLPRSQLSYEAYSQLILALSGFGFRGKFSKLRRR
ncbi:hypothetical protein C8J56DRAFT_1058659 [Mycena floridula]|nr:hypothetical protein C8J56DRAFT_1058659 [Mycena floridula]